eukprot:6312447-Pyramimonas_sp.AAC.1
MYPRLRTGAPAAIKPLIRPFTTENFNSPVHLLRAGELQGSDSRAFNIPYPYTYRRYQSH